MKDTDILLLGGAAILAYILFSGKDTLFDMFTGGGGGGGGFWDFLPSPSFLPPPSEPNTPPSLPSAPSPLTVTVSPSQSWTGVTYGQPGQPSTQFLANTLQEASIPTASQQTKMAASAAYAGAPPRVVAKIKAGKIF